MAILYEIPSNWIAYEPTAILRQLTEAKASIIALTQIPYQRSWADELQHLQLKREVAGTSRIEGAEFTEKELETALKQSPEQLETRSQRQAAAAVATYRWISGLAVDHPINESLIRNIHRYLVTGCDDDHCPPGELRGADQNVTFGTPRHRGCEGGSECTAAFAQLLEAVRTVYQQHDPLVQALALHYHLAAMHPFLDGNGRTARAVEALMLQRIGLRDTLFIAMSNYYYEEKTAYLDALNRTRAGSHDLTPFLEFALPGIHSQCRRLFGEIRLHVARALYRNTVTDLFGRLQSPRRRVMSARHVQLLDLLLEQGAMTLSEIIIKSAHIYALKSPGKARIRDLNYLLALDAIHLEKIPEKMPGTDAYVLRVNLEWPTQITETEFFRRAKTMPKGKVYAFLSK